MSPTYSLVPADLTPEEAAVCLAALDLRPELQAILLGLLTLRKRRHWRERRTPAQPRRAPQTRDARSLIVTKD